jgi:hypothetical protein
MHVQDLNHGLLPLANDLTALYSSANLLHFYMYDFRSFSNPSKGTGGKKKSRGNGNLI